MSIQQEPEAAVAEVHFNWKIAIVAAIAGAVGAFMVYWTTTTLR